MEPSCPCCQNYLSGEDCEIHQNSRSKKNSPGHPFPVELKMLDAGWGDWEKQINEYYLGCDDESGDEWLLDDKDTLQVDVLQQNQNSNGSPIIINFCDYSDEDPEAISIKSSSSVDDTNDKVGSPLGSKNNSELPEIESNSSLDAKLVIIVEDENIKKDVGCEGVVEDISQPDIGIDRKGCENELEISPLQKCMPTIPFFVESFDYNHKHGKLDIKNDLYPKRSPKRRSKASKKRRRKRSKSISIHSRHYTDSYYTIRPGYQGRKKIYSKHQANRLFGFPFSTSALYSGSPILAMTTAGTEALDSDSGVYKCPECDYSSNMNQIIHHYCEIHFNLTCPRCDNSFGEPHFLQHCMNCRAPKPKLQCPNCELTCTESSLLSLAMHIKFSHATKKCVTCEEHFVPQKFVEHARTCFFAPKQECTCPFCEKELVYTQLCGHIVTHPIAECPLCYKDISLDEAKEHIESCYLEKVNDSDESFGTVFNCPKCTLRFTFENMPAHIIKKHLSLNCVFCYTVMSQEEMREHIVTCCQKHQRVNNKS